MPKRQVARSSRAHSSVVPERPDILEGEDLPPPPKQARSLDRRIRLEESGLRLFAQQGFEATSVEQIAAAAEVPVGGFYLHFRSKRQLMLSLMNDLVVALSRTALAPIEGAHPRAILRAVLERGFEQDLRYFGVYRAWSEVVSSDAELAARNAELHRWSAARVAAVFRRLSLLPGARRGVDVDALAQTMDVVFWDMLSGAGHSNARQTERRLDAVVHVIYHGLFADDS